MKILSDYKSLLRYCKWIANNTGGYIKNIIIIILLNAAAAVVGVVLAVFSKNIIDNAVNGEFSKSILYAVVFGLLIVANLGVRAFSSVISVKTYELLANSIRKRVFLKVTITEWLPLTKYHSGDVLTRLTSDVNAVTTGVVDTLPGIISLGVQLLAAFGTLMYYEPALAVLAFVLGPVTVLFSRIWGRKLKQLQAKVQESESAYRSFLQEALENMLVIKAFQLEKNKAAKITELHGNRLKWVMKKNITGVVASTTLGIGFWTGYFLAFCWGAFKLSRGTTTFGTLTVFLQLVSQVQTPFIGLARTIPQIISAVSSSGRLMELEWLPEEKLSNNSLCKAGTGITLKDVTFSYDHNKPVLEKTSANILPGEIVGIIGQSGEGKTTLIRLLLALLKPDNGTVAFKTEDGRETVVSAQTRDLISYVPQGNTLFSGTIEENIRSGCTEASDEEVEAAAKAACAIGFIEELPDGIKSKTGEHGIGLSEGQAQRISIARALLRKTPILILDEATSALDMDSEMHVLNSIREMKPARTCIVITHRHTALNICTRILKLEDGRLLEQYHKGIYTEGCASA